MDSPRVGGSDARIACLLSFASRLPSTQGFIDASLAGIGWAMNPVQMVQSQLRDGTLVELVPGRSVVVPLYWQHTRLRVPMLDRLTGSIVTIARRALRQQRR